MRLTVAYALLHAAPESALISESTWKLHEPVPQADSLRLAGGQVGHVGRQAPLHADESEACLDGLINLSQSVAVDRPQAFQQALAIYCAELIQADRGSQMQAGAARMDDGFVGISRCGYFRGKWPTMVVEPY